MTSGGNRPLDFLKTQINERPVMVSDLECVENCAAELFFGLALFTSCICAGEIRLTVTMSPDAARAIRDGRRGNGLLPPPEDGSATALRPAPRVTLSIVKPAKQDGARLNARESAAVASTPRR